MIQRRAPICRVSARRRAEMVIYGKERRLFLLLIPATALLALLPLAAMP